MDPGRPAPSRLRRWGQRVLGALLALVFLPPLLVRGPLLGAIVARATRSLCGTITLEGGHLGWFVVPDLLLGRPIPVEVRGLRMEGADSGEVFFAGRVSAKVGYARNPWRITVDPALVSRGHWRLAVDKAGGQGGFLGAFRQVAPGATRDTCLTPAPRRGPRAAPAAGFASLSVRNAHLEDLDVELDFPVWGLALPRVRADGSLTLGEPGGPPFTFDVRGVRAPGGTLRVGPGGAAATAATTTARFDDVVIAHVGVPHDEPSDIALEVGHADSGRSRLLGKAEFTNVFAPHGRSGKRNPPGLDLDARWERLTDAAARLDAPWLPREALGELLDGTLAARVHGPFLGLSGALSLEGSRAGFEATVERGERAELDARVTNLALAPFLHESLEPLLAGRLSGQLRVKVELGAGFRHADLEIPTADVTLTREGASPQPRQIAFRVGPPAARPTAWRDADDTLVLGLTAARLVHRSLRLEGLSARWAELSARGALALDLPAPRATVTHPSKTATADPPARVDAADPPARVDAKVALTVTSLARWVPPATASARVAAEATVAGPLDHVRARLAFSPSTNVTILGEHFRAPSAITATIDDRRVVTIDRLAIDRQGGGRLEVRGRAERGGSLAGQLHLSKYPLGALPGLETVHVPAAIGGGRVRSLHDALAGELDAALKVSGRTSRPAFDGALTFTGVELAGRRLGDGGAHVRARGWTLALDATLGPSLAIDLDATRRRDGVAADANLEIHDLELAPWLPPALAGLQVAVSGIARVAVAPRRPFSSQAKLEAVGGGSALTIESTTSGDQAQASARGNVELAGLRSLWGKALDAASGAIAVDVKTAPGLPLAGTLVVARALSLRPRGWPLAFAVAEGGRLDVEGERVHIPGLTMTAPGASLSVAGDVLADLATPERSAIDLKASGRLDAAAAARQARLPQIASASGTLTIDARAKGQAGDPNASGTLHIEGVEVRPTSPSWPTLRLDGVVDATGHEITTRFLRVASAGPAVAAGTVTLGAPQAPASVALGPGWPPRVARVDVPVEGRGLHVGDATSSFEIDSLDLDLRLEGDPARELVLKGDVGVARARVDPFAKKKKSSGPARPWFEGLPPHLTLDLTVHGPDDAIVVNVPVLPDVGLGFRCHVAGNAHGGTISGRLRGSSLYSRIAIGLFGPKGTGECHVLKER
jgi:hypothetical protein